MRTVLSTNLAIFQLEGKGKFGNRHSLDLVKRTRWISTIIFFSTPANLGAGLPTGCTWRNHIGRPTDMG